MSDVVPDSKFLMETWLPIPHCDVRCGFKHPNYSFFFHWLNIELTETRRSPGKLKFSFLVETRVNFSQWELGSDQNKPPLRSRPVLLHTGITCAMYKTLKNLNETHVTGNSRARKRSVHLADDLSEPGSSSLRKYAIQTENFITQHLNTCQRLAMW